MTYQAKRRSVYLFLFLLAALIGGGYFASTFVGGDSAAANDQDQTAKKNDERVPVQVAEVSPGAISSFVSATANLRALREVDVVSQTEGLVRRTLVEEGDRVSEGQALCRLDPNKLEIRLQAAEQKLAQARLQREKGQIRREKALTQIRNTKEDMGRYQQLFDEKLVSERDVAQIRYRLDELKHDERVSSHETRELAHRTAELEADIAETRLLLSQTEILAPFAGVITERVVEPGQMVRNLDKLFRLANFSRLYADVFLSEKDSRLIQQGQAAQVVLGLDEELTAEGRVLRISPVVDQSTGTVKVTVEFSGARGAFKSGAFVRLDIETNSHDGNILVPKRSILEQDGNYSVFVVEGDTVRRVEVSLGYRNGGFSEALTGLTGGEKVVVAGQGALKDGSKVRVVS